VFGRSTNGKVGRAARPGETVNRRATPVTKGSGKGTPAKGSPAKSTPRQS
jgi:hypothetical protein